MIKEIRKKSIFLLSIFLFQIIYKSIRAYNVNVTASGVRGYEEQGKNLKKKIQTFLFQKIYKSRPPYNVNVTASGAGGCRYACVCVGKG